MSRQDRQEAQLALMEEAGELDGCEAFQVFDEERDDENVFPVFGAMWRGETPVFDELSTEMLDLEA